VAEGHVEPPPVGAFGVEVLLQEWAVEPEPSEADAGQVYFLAENAGTEPHELVVIRTDLAPDELPTVEGKVDEEAEGLELIGEIEGFAAGSEASGVFDLQAGDYVLVCNIVEVEDGENESHYEQGMYVSFTVV
jgi:uncharacterized cupredoxin-like copper-binding protein